MNENTVTLTKQDEITTMQYIVQIMYDSAIITDTERKKILSEYF